MTPLVRHSQSLTRHFLAAILLFGAGCGSADPVSLAHARVVDSTDARADARSAAAATVAALEAADHAAGRGGATGAAATGAGAIHGALDDATGRLAEVRGRVEALLAEREALLAGPEAGPERARNLARIASELTREAALTREVAVHRRGAAAAALAADPTRGPTLAEARAALAALEGQPPGEATSEVLGVTEAEVVLGAPATVQVDGAAFPGVVARVEGPAVAVRVRGRLRVGDPAEVRIEGRPGP
jgi:hypothetical protein